jgi:hypothetical protein
MSEDQKKLPTVKKAYEISYALFRMSARLFQAAFKEQLERQALILLEAATNGDHVALGRVAEIIEYLVKFGGDIGLLHLANVETLIAELGVLCTLAPRGVSAASPEKVFLEDIFQSQEDQKPLFSKTEAKPRPIIRQSAIRQEGDQESGNPANRQSAILDRIRQSGNCRLKDLQELLPGCSERTIRYDLQSLVEQNLVERVGAGGPSVFYKVR